MEKKSDSVSENIREALKALANPALAAFNARLLPGIPKENILGIYTKDLRSLARTCIGKYDATRFLECLPHRYVEENLLHGYILAHSAHDIAAVLESLEKFLPFIDNWMVCDQCCGALKILKLHPGAVFERVSAWLRMPHAYTRRFAMVTLLDHFMDRNFSPAVLETAAGVQSSDYCVNMAAAWLFSTALAKHYECAVRYFGPDPPVPLSAWVHNKSIQKAVESRRLGSARKERLKGLKKR